LKTFEKNPGFASNKFLFTLKFDIKLNVIQEVLSNNNSLIIWI